MKYIEINQILSEKEVLKYCENNNFTLIVYMINYKEQTTTLKVV